MNRLKVLINEMTLLAKLDSEKHVVEQEAIDLEDLIIKVLDRVHPYALEHNIKINYLNHDSVTIVGDENKLLRAFLNIMMNGVRYAKTEVQIKVDVIKNKVSITITDDGNGIVQLKIF